ncbi:MAG: hypothetical protein QOH97_5772 [Actinoplanes sp.]|nr:hypothetical protein [Actinoplanes sp.]
MAGIGRQSLSTCVQSHLMDMVWKIVLGAGIGLLVVWLALIAVLLLAGRRYERPGLGEMLRLLPDLLRLLKRLASDKNLPRGVRVRLWALLIYLAVPIDLIPDFIPVIGYADDAIIVALALRSVARRAGLPALQQHWPGTPAGLTAVLRAAGISAQGTTSS